MDSIGLFTRLMNVMLPDERPRIEHYKNDEDVWTIWAVKGIFEEGYSKRLLGKGSDLGEVIESIVGKSPDEEI